MPAQMPIAVPRCSGGKVAVMIERLAGLISAPPTPWTARAPIRKLMFWARPHATEAATNSTRPMMNTFFRPNRSASLPPSSISTAKVSV